MNIRIHRSDFTFEDFTGVEKIARSWNDDLLITLDDPNSIYGSSDRSVSVFGLTSIEIRVP
ncbi:hypothetical protein ACPUER_12035 [Burkholderia sp. DN3021]|uniref:hypothetical protein n=1 Tax=Burkholderia sp. DN3021 TaxID=3410137 RepID=UPI003C7D60E3